MQQDLKDIGITADLKILDRATYWTLIGKPGKCGVGLNDWWMDFPDPSDFIIPLYSKSTAIDEGTNPSFWWSPQTEKMIARGTGQHGLARRASSSSWRSRRRSWPTRRACRCTSPR